MAHCNIVLSTRKNRILTLIAFVILCFALPALGSQDPKDQPKTSFLGKIAQKIRGTAASVVPPIQITLTEQLSTKIDNILDKLNKLIEGSSHLRNLLQIKEKLDDLVKKVSEEVRAAAPIVSSQIDQKHGAEKNSFSVVTPNINAQSLEKDKDQKMHKTSISINDVNKELIQLREQLDTLITKFVASNKDSKEQKELSEDDIFKNELLKEITKFKERLVSLITILSTNLENPRLELVYARLQEIQTEYNNLVNTFKNKSLGGLYGTLEKNIKELGTILDKTVTALSSKLSTQMRTELQQVIGFPTLELLKNIVENDLALIKSNESLDKQRFTNRLDEYNTLIESVLNTIAQGTLHNELTKVQKIILDTKQDPALTKESIIASLLRVKTNIELILGTNNGLEAVLLKM